MVRRGASSQTHTPAVCPCRMHSVTGRAAQPGAVCGRRGRIHRLCQLVGELAHWVTDLADEHGVPIADIHLILLEAASRLLPGWERLYSERAEHVLRRKGIDVRLSSKLEKVEPTRVTFSGETLSTHTIVWAGGIRAPSLLASNGLSTGRQGRVLVDDYLRVTQYPAIYVAGDSALFVKAGQPLPATAALALRQGAYVATTIADEVNGQPIEPYRPSNPGMLVSLGGSDAVGDLLGVSLQGFAAGLVKESIERLYISTLTGKLPVIGRFRYDKTSFC
ncbi:FAD-dependent oxidoreductase [Candidatus Poribacteria bacterium]|nr:FAD-dependent oxidoreductase [Candidatus Poribacteria bacterium]